VVKKILYKFKRITYHVGNIITIMILGFFYFTIFPLFVVLFRAFMYKQFFPHKRDSKWVLKEKTLNVFSDFKTE
jgi:hypothetical protein